MSDDKASVTVRIAGEEHTIRANVEAAYTRKCAKLVDDRIQEIRTKSGLIEGHKVAILAALSIADEYFQVQEEVAQIRRETASRVTNLVRRVEAELAQPDAGAAAKQG